MGVCKDERRWSALSHYICGEEHLTFTSHVMYVIYVYYEYNTIYIKKLETLLMFMIKIWLENKQEFCQSDGLGWTAYSNTYHRKKLAQDCKNSLVYMLVYCYWHCL